MIPNPTRMKRRAACLAGGLTAGLALAPAALAQSLTEYSLPPLVNGFAFAAPVQGRDGNLYGFVGGNAPTIYISTPAGSITTEYVGSAPESYYICTTGMILGRDGNFYGTCGMVGGGTSDFAFRYTPSGGSGAFTPFATLYTDANGYTSNPNGLVQAADGNFYGTAFGGRDTNGYLFRITPAGVVTTLKTFPAGYDPTGPLVQAKNGLLYGTSENGSTICCGNGTVFSVSATGKVKPFYNFDGANGVQSPVGGVIQANDGSFYGVTHIGGAYNYGSIYKITQQGVLTDLHDVNPENDGASYPDYNIYQATDGNFYGTLNGCASGCGPGELFKMTSAGVFSPLFQIVIPPGGCPYALPGCLPNSGNMEHTNGTLFGVLEQGGVNGTGTLYAETANPMLKANVSLQETSGTAGTLVDILGQGFLAAKKVRFGTHNAGFTVVSDTYMTATVPAGATTGYVYVNEPGLLLKSQQSYLVK